MENSLLKQLLRMGTEEGWTVGPLQGGEPPLWNALSRESSVPLAGWVTATQTHKVFM